jgi:hypothetical protein
MVHVYHNGTRVRTTVQLFLRECFICTRYSTCTNMYTCTYTCTVRTMVLEYRGSSRFVVFDFKKKYHGTRVPFSWYSSTIGTHVLPWYHWYQTVPYGMDYRRVYTCTYVLEYHGTYTCTYSSTMVWLVCHTMVPNVVLEYHGTVHENTRGSRCTCVPFSNQKVVT